MIVDVPTATDFERGLVGAILMAPAAVLGRAWDAGLRRDHFHDRTARHVFEAALALQERGEDVDVPSLAAESGVDRGDVEALAVRAPAVAAIAGYVRRIMEAAERRVKRDAAYRILEGVAGGDRDVIADGEGLLHVERADSRSLTPDALAHRTVDRLEAPPAGWATPWRTLTRHLAGGLRPGQTTILGGYTSHGKSVVADQVAEHVARGGVPTHVFLTEMAPEDRGLRYVARDARISLGKLMAGTLEGDDAERAVRAAASIPFGVTEASGWTPEDVAREIVRRRYGLAVVDLFHGLNVGDGQTADWDRASRVLNAAARRSGAHVVLVAHLNRNRANGALPMPTLADLRSTGSLANDADNVVFVWRAQSNDGTVLEDSSRIYVAKARNGVVGGAEEEFSFDGPRQTFRPVAG